LTAIVFDFGLRQIGIALAEPRIGLVRPLSTITARDGIPSWEALDLLVGEWQPDVLVVGLPLNMDGTPSEMADRARGFGTRLADRYGLDVAYADERLSTFEAISRGARPADAHARAAEVIGETWLSEGCPDSGPPPGQRSP